jgi:hypothetical protein
LLRKVRSLLFRGEGIMYEEDGFPLTTGGDDEEGGTGGDDKGGEMALFV